ncbi:MAG: hypothetical protein KBD96_04460 [Brachymonas sp.]|jgi:hypothetical protein|nr:hypothetical protein [Brachymonas sp.]MBP6138811.1 hypothetical protein [Brachymonas sp.]MBP6966942.1 hypothetical protein [Brachymonas sp.]MBP7247174.1 hypothetical protein [Brachymonas sp.]MBP7740098.1 hypothetical protein [Brachymonas sp.]
MQFGKWQANLLKLAFMHTTQLCQAQRGFSSHWPVAAGKKSYKLLIFIDFTNLPHLLADCASP